LKREKVTSLLAIWFPRGVVVEMDETVIRVEGLRKWFPVRMGFFRSLFSRMQLYVKAVDGISFEVRKKEIFALAGESGSGKTTTGRVLLKLVEPTNGKMYFKGKEITFLGKNEFKPFRRKMQMIFQDPYESLNPRMTIQGILEEPLLIQGIMGEDKEERVFKALEDVDLIPPEEFLLRYPHELSGGQRQRVAVARALILNPEFVVADEPVSMLDVSIRAGILKLMEDLMKKYEVSFLYITHDLALARHICDRIAIMYLGKIVEMCDMDDLVKEPLHPYTRALMAAVPVPDPTSRRVEVKVKGEIPSPVNPPPGCRFHTRCPEYIGSICKTVEPALIEIKNGHYTACHLYSK
jgi:peptide/nickel transport system ATP-binding protein